MEPTAPSRCTDPPCHARRDRCPGEDEPHAVDDGGQAAAQRLGQTDSGPLGDQLDEHSGESRRVKRP
jgi:hypothetical protein